jgi:hypothetical protein
MAKLIRLRPLDKKKGHVIHRYTVFQTTFEESKGWYRVPEHVASYLATVHQLADDEDSPLAFDVCTREEAQRIDAAEKKKAEERALAAEPNVAMARDVAGFGEDLTTADLRDPGRRSRSTVAAGRRA